MPKQPIKLYCPLEVNTDPDSILAENHGDIVSEFEYATIPNSIAASYAEIVRDAVVRDMDSHPEEREHGLATYLRPEDTPAGKIHSIRPSVEIWNGELWGVLNIETNEDLTPHEMGQLIEQHWRFI